MGEAEPRNLRVERIQGQQHSDGPRRGGKPRLGLRLQDPHDPEDERRYKLVYGYFSRDEEGRRLFGLSAATSPDGLHWTRIPKPLFVDDKPFDTFNVVFWDDYLGKYVAYVRRRVKQKLPPQDRSPSEPTARRYVGRAESTDFVKWTTPSQ